MNNLFVALGEATASANNDDDDDDDDLQVVTRASGETLKCPIMGSYYEDPVKSSVCGHTYSRTGIENHLRSSRKCPPLRDVLTKITLHEISCNLTSKCK
jgi:SUMO ligase MMS21 Smc5/6 complex component